MGGGEVYLIGLTLVVLHYLNVGPYLEATDMVGELAVGTLVARSQLGKTLEHARSCPAYNSWIMRLSQRSHWLLKRKRKQLLLSP